MAAERRFRAMGSEAHVIVVGGPPGLIEKAVNRVGELEQRWDPSLPDSEVSQLSRWAGIPVAVSSDTVTLVEHAMVAWRICGGAFDPTARGPVVRAGYDRSFERAGTSPSASGTPGFGAGEIAVSGETVTLPAGTGFDPSGIGKGLAADLVCAELLVAGAEGICVNLGGDVRVAGTDPGGGSWTIAVEHPQADHAIAHVRLVEGAVATSTTLRRRWQFNREDPHHDTDMTVAAVVAGQAWMAQVLAKAVLLSGSAHPFDIVEGTGAQARALDQHGGVRATPGFSTYLACNPRPASVEPITPRIAA